jgi:hypothetical protein
MPAALMILAAVGSESQNLIGNPQLTFFKMVYKHYANFATEPIELALEGTPDIDFSKGPTVRCTIDRNADLLSHMYLLVDIPDIYSGYDESIVPNLGYQFQWIRELGSQMIKSVSLSIGGLTVQKLQGNFIQLWHELYSPTNKNLDVFQHMSGNVPDMYDPAQSQYAKGVYPTSTLDPTLTDDPELTVPALPNTADIANPYLRTASVRGRTLYIPLPFWFSQNSGQALPLVALQKNDTTVTIEFRPLRELYRVRDTNAASPTYGQHIAPELTNAKHNINSFVSAVAGGVDGQRSSVSARQGNNLQQTDISARNQKLNVNPRLLCTYVFLDEKERTRFATTNHKYLIEKYDYLREGGIYNTTLQKMHLNHPTKSILWFLQHEDAPLRNDWSNYTNWKTYGGKAPAYSLGAYVPEEGEEVHQITGDATDTIPIRFPRCRPTGSASTFLTKFDYPATERHILKEGTLLLNGIELFTTRHSDFFEYVQAYEHEHKRSVPGVYSYSFALLPRQFQPSGACDMSRVQQTDLKLVTQTQNTDDMLKYVLQVISVHYNVLDIMGGMGHLEYAD